MAQQGGGKQDELQPIIIKKVKKGGGGHHGGAWKVAYADFVTAMMAFFLLLWLLNVTTKEQKEGIAKYFDPNPMITVSESGAGGMLGGLTVSPEGAMVSTVQPLAPQQEVDPALRPGADPRPPEERTEETTIEEEQLMEEIRKREEAQFAEAEAALQQAMRETPELKELANNLIVDMTPEGLRIQVVDQEGKPMFPSGSAEMYERTRTLMAKVGQVIQKMPNQISVRGHTDSAPYGTGASYTNWELSTDRANSSRRVLLQSGLPETRLNNVVGKADTDHLFEDNPRDARNRRISIILLREELTVKQGANRSSQAVKEMEIKKKQLYQRSSGKVEFP